MWMFRAIFKNPEDLGHLLKLKVASVAAQRAVPADPNLAFCYQLLRRANEIMSVVVQQLGPDLRNPVCVFYLVLRGLEAVEDDITLDDDKKMDLLRDFHQKIFDPMFFFPSREGENQEYGPLMDKFHMLTNALVGLPYGYQEVIAEIVQRMGQGIVKYLTTEVDSPADYDEYCHYTAGLVWLGFTRLFYTAGVEQFTPDYLSNAMGLFLQKTNLIRDYLEQINSQPKPKPRWPREVWVKYADKNLEDFKDGKHDKEALLCLNEMVTDALSHALDCLQYMASLRDPANLRFCAIPQIIAIGTLAMCYNNVEVFRGTVTLRRGLKAKFFNVKTMPDVYGAFHDFTHLLGTKIEKTDPNATNTQKRVEEILSVCTFESNYRRASTVENKVGHKTCLVLALGMLLVLMLAIVAM